MRKVTVLFLCFSITFFSCKKNDNDDNNNNSTPVDVGTVLLHLHNFIDDIDDIGELSGIPNTDNNGRTITISNVGMYISEFEMEKSDGTVYKFAGKKVLKVFENVLYEVGEVPIGNYNIIRFKVGLDSNTNSLPPNASSDSVILNKPNMWFGATAQPDGYVFMNIQGTIDTSSGLTGSMAPFVYKIGTNANYQQITVTGINITIVKSQAETIHMVADYNTLFNGIQINHATNLSITTPADNSTALATAVVNNIVANV
ncbi:MAG: hypothetical protein IPK10_09775 [Bacteroidetes bacterium]|nr:hypothetical protein [Bacteroidota bacterium]